jgi:F-type H+-transporting ATPase subunit b
MRRNKKIDLFASYLICVLAALLLSGSNALAAENTHNWRSTFDLVMRWINFGIIAFFLVKFGRKPIKDFLANRKEEIDHQIKRSG